MALAHTWNLEEYITCYTVVSQWHSQKQQLIAAMVYGMWYITCWVDQCEINGFSCDVDGDVFQRFDLQRPEPTPCSH